MSRVQLALRVADLESSVAFYRSLFGVEPAKRRPGYANCDAVRAAGAAPIRPGDPGWSSRFDGDGDGVGCE